jgi:hypothetical protein
MAPRVIPSSAIPSPIASFTRTVGVISRGVRGIGMTPLLLIPFEVWWELWWWLRRLLLLLLCAMSSSMRRLISSPSATATTNAIVAVALGLVTGAPFSSLVSVVIGRKGSVTMAIINSSAISLLIWSTQRREGREKGGGEGGRKR